MNIKLEGFEELERALQEFPKTATSKATARRALTKAAKPLVEDAKSLVPISSGELKESITVSTKLSSRQKSKRKKLDPVEVFVGAGPLAHAHITEFGSSDTTAQPFMRPAWDANKAKVLDEIKKTMEAEIMKTAKRLEARAKKAIK